MRAIRVLAVAAIAVFVLSEGPSAQQLSSGAVPAEFPPASYAGRQYVDSKGCVFIRAGVDGATTWVPRVSRSRQLVCGFQPSLPGVQRTADAPAQAAQPAPAQRQAPQRQAAPVRTAPQPAARTAPRPQAAQPTTVVRRTMPAPQPAARPAPTVVMRPAPTRIAPQAPVVVAPRTTGVVSAPAPVTKPAVRQTATTSCPGLTGVSARYSTGEGVRCGPQDAPHVTYIQGGGGTGAKTRRVKVYHPLPSVAAPVYAPSVGHAAPHHAAPAHVVPSAPRQVVTGQTRVVPRHVYAEQQSAKGITVPKGYKAVWNDDRLNPYRAQQTLDGKARMELVWSRTVPRYLIDASTGRDVSFKFPGLRYPFTSFEQQRAAGVVVSTQGRVVPEPVRVTRTNSRSHDGRRGTAERTSMRGFETARSQGTGTRAVVSTRSQQPAPQAAAFGTRYVQAGMFGVHGNAQAAVRRLSGMGVPARMSRVTQGGKTYTLVLAGPYGSEQELRTGLQRTRQAGFSDAFPR